MKYQADRNSPVPYSLRKIVKHKLQKLLDVQVILPSTCPWTSPSGHERWLSLGGEPGGTFCAPKFACASIQFDPLHRGYINDCL